MRINASGLSGCMRSGIRTQKIRIFSAGTHSNCAGYMQCFHNNTIKPQKRYNLWAKLQKYGDRIQPGGYTVDNINPTGNRYRKRKAHRRAGICSRAFQRKSNRGSPRIHCPAALHGHIRGLNPHPFPLCTLTYIPPPMNILG